MLYIHRNPPLTVLMFKLCFVLNLLKDSSVPVTPENRLAILEPKGKIAKTQPNAFYVRRHVTSGTYPEYTTLLSFSASVS